MYFQISDGSNTNFVRPVLDATGTSLIDGNFHHVAATWDGTTDAGGLKLYFDGTEVASSTATISAIQSVDTTLNIGGQASGVWSFPGVIDDARIWNVARTQVQIQADMDNDTVPGMDALPYY